MLKERQNKARKYDENPLARTVKTINREKSKKKFATLLQTTNVYPRMRTPESSSIMSLKIRAADTLAIITRATLNVWSIEKMIS